MNWRFSRDGREDRNGDCAGLRPLLSLYSDGMASPEEARQVEAHLTDCADCRAALEWMRATRQVLAHRPAAIPPADLRARIARAIAEAETAPVRPALSFRLRPAYGWSAALAASMAFAALVVSRAPVRVATHSSPPIRVAVNGTPKPALTLPVHPAPAPAALPHPAHAVRPSSAAPRPLVRPAAEGHHRPAAPAARPAPEPTAPRVVVARAPKPHPDPVKPAPTAPKTLMAKGDAPHAAVKTPRPHPVTRTLVATRRTPKPELTPAPEERTPDETPTSSAPTPAANPPVHLASSSVDLSGVRAQLADWHTAVRSSHGGSVSHSGHLSGLETGLSDSSRTLAITASSIDR